MTSLDTLFLISGVTLLVALLLGRLRLTGPLLVLLYAVQLWALIRTGTLFGDPVPSSWLITVLDQPMTWRYDALSWFFALITIGTGLAAALFATGAWMEKYRQSQRSGHAFHLALAANVFSMVLLVGAADFLTLFLGWELVSWCSFLLMAVAGGVASKAALKYVTYAFSGAMAILGAMALLYAQVGSLEYPKVLEALPSMSNGQIWTLLLMMGGGFAVKMGLLPFHLWQAEAYAETPGPGSAFLGTISARMGLYAIIVVFVGMVGIARLVQIEVPYTFPRSAGLDRRAHHHLAYLYRAATARCPLSAGLARYRSGRLHVARTRGG
jgi:formate hydrogenlyase subunit 3/multisubunit Na+/H+ antiporter MnhD subunit